MNLGEKGVWPIHFTIADFLHILRETAYFFLRKNELKKIIATSVTNANKWSKWGILADVAINYRMVHMPIYTLEIPVRKENQFGMHISTIISHFVKFCSGLFILPLVPSHFQK